MDQLRKEYIRGRSEDELKPLEHLESMQPLLVWNAWDVVTTVSGFF